MNTANAPATPGPSLERFSQLTRAWFQDAFAAPTAAQAGAWAAIAGGQDALVVAPTGSGKTLAAFLSAIDRLATAPPVPEAERLRVLYVSPLKALAADVDRNLPDVLITTPESLFLLLTSQARAALASVDTVIIDEVHSMVATKRGAHLA